MDAITKFSGPWHVITDSQGYANVHHAPDDDGDTGDIVATCFQDDDHVRLIAAALDMLVALQRVYYEWDGEPEDMIHVQEAITRATGAQS